LEDRVRIETLMKRSLGLVVVAVLGLALPSSAQEAAPTTAPATALVTPLGYEDAETFVFAERVSEPLRLHVVKPVGWKASEPRAAFVFFYGGGFVKGSPDKSIGWARMAAKWGMVGIAPDYRVKDRFNGSPADCVADGRAALRWVQDHAAELGIDTRRIVVGGSSAGGHLALWTAITATPPGSSEAEAPTMKPAALVLMSGLTDTTYGVYGRRATQAGVDGAALSPQHHLDGKMPPTIMFHGDADTVVDHSQAANLHQKLRDNGAASQLVTVPGGSHGFSTQFPEWKDKSRELIRAFLIEHKLVD